MSKQAIYASVVTICIACSSSEAVDIGDGRSGQRLSDYAAVWEGYAEAHAFADGSDRVEIALDDDGNGTLRVGEAQSPDTSGDTLPKDTTQFHDLVPGFLYPIRGAGVEDSRLRLAVDLKELYRPWCEAQAPTPFDPEALPGVYSCLAHRTVLSGTEDGQCITEEGRILPCEALDLCLGTCECTVDSCTIGDHPPRWREAASHGVEYSEVRHARIDGTLNEDGHALDATLSVFDAAGPRVRLERQ